MEVCFVELLKPTAFTRLRDSENKFVGAIISSADLASRVHCLWLAYIVLAVIGPGAECFALIIEHFKIMQSDRRIF